MSDRRASGKSRPGNTTSTSIRAGGLLPSITLDADAEAPLYEQLCLGLRSRIEEGSLKPGTRLASSRALAADLGVSRFTVLTALAQLSSEGYLSSRKGAGTFVARDLPAASMRTRPPDATKKLVRQAAGTVPQLSARGLALASIAITGPRTAEGEPRAFRPRRAPLDIFPVVTWTRLLRRQWRRSRPEVLDYGEPAGYQPLRSEIAAHVKATRGVRCSANQVIITNGGQQAVTLLFRTLVDPGDAAWMEEPGLLDVRGAMMEAGVNIVPVPVDDDGIIVAKGRRLAPKARLAYVSPSHQYPTGATLSAERRRELLDWADTSGAWIVEDDYDSYFRYEGRPLPALQRLDADRNDGVAARVAYVGTFSKTMFPNLRLGYCIVPERVADAVANARAVADRNSPLVEQAALAEFIAGGHYDRHLRRIRKICAARYAVLRPLVTDRLGSVFELHSMDAGTHIVVTVRDTYLAKRKLSREERLNLPLRISRAAEDAGLIVFPMQRYCLRPPAKPQLVLGYGGLSESLIRSGVEKLARVLAAL